MITTSTIVAKAMEHSTKFDGWPWIVTFKRVERTNGNIYSSMPVFRDKQAISTVDDWLRENGSEPHCFLDQNAIMFRDETDALLCFTHFA